MKQRFVAVSTVTQIKQEHYENIFNRLFSSANILSHCTDTPIAH